MNIVVVLLLARRRQKSQRFKAPVEVFHVEH